MEPTTGSANLPIQRSWTRRMGTGFRKWRFSRPTRRVVTRSASSRTARCFMTPNRVIPGRCSHSSPSVWPSRSKSRSSRTRRFAIGEGPEDRSGVVRHAADYM